MRPSQALKENREAIRAIAERHRVRNVRVFGSVLRDDDTEESDLDLLVDPTPQTTLMDIAAIPVEVEQEFGIRADILTPRSLPPVFRDRVLQEATPL